MRALQDALDQIETTGSQLVVISPEIRDSAYASGARAEAAFELLSDLGNRVARKFGIVYTVPEDVSNILSGFFDLSVYNDDSSNELPLAVTYIVDTDYTIRYAFLEADYKRRAEPSEIVAALKALH